MEFIKLIPSKLLNALQSIPLITLPKGISEQKCVIISHMIKLQSSRSYKVDKDDMVEIPSALIKTALGTNSGDYKNVITFMESNNFIKSNGYVKEIKSKSYKINPDYEDEFVGQMVEYKITNDTLNKRTQNAIDKTKEIKRMNNSVILSENSHNNLKTMQYDYDSAIDWLKYLYDNQIEYNGKVITKSRMGIIESKLRILKLGNSEPKKYRYMSRSLTNGRVDSDITSLNKNFRRFILGIDLYNIDCVSSQPGLLLVLMKFVKNPLYVDGLLDYLRKIIEFNINVNSLKDPDSKQRKRKQEADRIITALYNIEIPTEKQIEEYRQVIENGKFYETIMSYYKMNKNMEYSRDDIKDMMYLELYGSGKSNIISCLFPGIGKFINSLKEIFKESSVRTKQSDKVCRLFPILMQAIESFIWIEKILTRLDNNGYKYYSIHDSVLVEDSIKDDVVNIIKEVYNSFGVNPKMDKKSNKLILENLKKEKINIGIEL